MRFFEIPPEFIELEFIELELRKLELIKKAKSKGSN